MGKGGGKCASREQTAASMRTPRLPATRPTPATNPAIEDKALESEGSLEPLISKNEETLQHPPGDVDDDIDVDVNFDQAEEAYHGTESGRRLLAASPASDYRSEYHTAQPSPALSFSSGRRTPDTLYHSGPEDLQSYMVSPAHPPGMPLPTKYLRSTVDEPVAPLPDDDDLFPAADTPVPSTSNASVPRPGVLRKRHSMASSSSAQGGSRSLLTSLSMPAPVGRLGERSKPFSASPARETEEVISPVQLGLRKEDEVTVAAPSAAIELPNVITPQEVQASKYSADVGENWELVSPQPRSITSEWVGVPKRDTEAAVAGVAESIEDTPQQKDLAEVAIEREIAKPSATTDVGPKRLLVDHVVEGLPQSGLVSESHDGEADTVRSLGSDRSDDIETQSVNGDAGGYVLLGPTSAEQLGKSADAAQSNVVPKVEDVKDIQEAWKAVKPELEVAKSEKPAEPSSAQSIAGMFAETKPVSAAVPEEVATLGETEPNEATEKELPVEPLSTSSGTKEPSEEEKQEAVEETPIEMKSTGEEAAPLLGKHVEVTFKKPSTDEVVPQLEIVKSPEMSPDCQELPPPDQRVEEAMEAPLSEEIVPKEQRGLGTEEVLKELTIEEDSPMLDGIVATTGAAEPYEPAAQELIAERKQIPVAGEEPSRTELPGMVDEKEIAIAPSSQDNMEEVGEAPVTAVAVPKHVSVDGKELSKKEIPEMLEEKDTDTAPIPEENMEEVSDAPMPPVAAPKSETIKDQKEVPEEVEPAADEKDVPETSSQETIKPSNRELGVEPENLSIDVEEPTKEEQPEVMVEKGLEGSAAGEEETKNVEATTETHPTMVPEPGVETAQDSEKVRMDIKADPQAAEKEVEKEISVAEPLVAISQETKPLEASDREIFNEPRESLVDAEASYSKVEEAEEALNRKETPAEPEHPEESTETAPLDVSASEVDNAQDNKELTTELKSKPVLEEANVGVEHQPVSQTEPGVPPELGAIEQQPEDASWRTWKEELETQGVENVKMDRHPETAPVAPNASQTSPSADEPVMNRARELPQLLNETEPQVAEEIPKEQTSEIVEDKCVDFTPSVAKRPTFKQESEKEIEDPQLEIDAIPEEGDVKSEAEKREVCVEAPVAVSQPTESHKEVVPDPQEMLSETENSSKELDPEIVDDREVDSRLVAQDLPTSEEPVEHILEAPAPTFVSPLDEIPRSDQEETQAEIQDLEVGIPPANEDTAASESLPVVESEQYTEEVHKETVADEVAPLKGVEPVEDSGKDIVVKPKDVSDRTHGISREPEPAPFEEEDVKDIEEAAPAEYVEEANRSFPSGELASPRAENSTEVLAPEKASTPVERELEVQPTADKVPIPQEFEPHEDTDRELVAQPQDTSTEAEVEAKELAPEMVERKEIEVTSAVQPPRTTAEHVAVPGEGTSSDEAKVSNASEEAPTILEDMEEPIKASTFDEVAPGVDEEKGAHPSDGMATSVEAELEAPQPDKAEQTMNNAEDTSNVPEEPKIEPTTEELPEAEPIEAVNSDLVVGPRDDVNEEPKDLDSKALEGHDIVAAGAEAQSPFEQVKESAELHPSDEVPEVEEEKTEVIPAGDQTLAPNENVETSEPPLSDMIVPDVETAKDIDTVPRELDNEPLGEEGGLKGEPPIGDPFLAKTQDPELPETTGGDFAAEAESSKTMNGVPKELENQPVTEDRDETESPDVEPIVAASPEETPAETTAHHYVSEPKEISHICSEDHEAEVANHEGLDFLPAPENTPTSELHSEEPIEKRLADVKSPERVSAPDALEVPKDLDSKPVTKEKEFQEGPPIVEPTLVASQDLEPIKSTVRDDVPEVTAKEISPKELVPTVLEENAINEPFPENAARLDEHAQEEPSGAEATPAVIDEKDVETEPTETTQDEEIPEELEARLAEVATDSTPVMDDESHFAEPTKDRTLKPEVAYRKTVADPALDEAPITPTKEPVLVEEAPTDVLTKDQESDLVGERKLQAPPPTEEHDVIEEMPIQEAASEATLEPPPEGVKEDDLHASLPHRKVEEPEHARADVVQEASDDANPEPVSSERESEILDDTVLKAGPEGVEDKAMQPDTFEDSLIAGSTKEVAQEPETEVVEQKDIKDPLAKQQVQEKEDTPSQEAASAAEGVQEALESPSSDEALHGVEDVTEKLPKELEAKPEEKEEESEHSFFPAIVGMLPRIKPVFASAAEEPPTTAEHVQSPLEPPQIDVSREGESLESTEAENTKENSLNPLSEVIVNASQSEPEVEEQELDAIREDFTVQAPLNPSNGFIEDKKIEDPFAEAKVEENKNARSDVVQGTPTEETTKEAALQPESDMVAESDRPEQHEIDETAKEGAWEPEGEAVTEKDSLPPTADSEEIVEDRDPTLPTPALEMVEKESLLADEVDQAPAQIGASIPDVTEEAPITETTREVGVEPESKADGQQDFEVPLAEPQVEEKDVAADLISTLDCSTRTVPFEPEREQVQEKEEGLPLAKSGVEEQERAQSDVVEAAIVTDSTKEDPSKPAGDSVEENQLEASVREAERVEKQAVVVEEAPIDTSTKESGLEPEEELVENELEPSLPQPEDVKEPAQLDGVDAAPVNDSIEEVASKPEEDLVENKELEDSLPEAEGVEKQVDVVEEAPTDKTTKGVALGPQKELVTKELETSLHEPEDVEEPAQTVEVEAAPADDSSEKIASNSEGQVVELKTSLPEAEEVEKQADVVEETPPNKSPKELALEPENHSLGNELEPSLLGPRDIEEPAQTVGIDAAPVYDSTKEMASKSQGDLVNRTDLEASLPKAERVGKQADVVEEAQDDTSTRETGLEPQEEMVVKGLEPSLPQPEDVEEPAQTDRVEAAPFDDSTQNVASKPEEDLVRKDELEDSLPEEEQVEKKADVVEEAPNDMSSKEVGLEPQELLITKNLGSSPSEPENVEEQAQVEVEPTPVDDSTKEVALKPEGDFIEENELKTRLPKAGEVQKHPDVVEEAPAPTHKEAGLEPEEEIVEPEPEHIEEQAQTVGIEAAPVYDSTKEIQSQGDLVDKIELEASLPKAEVIEMQADVVEEAQDDTSTKETGLEPQEEMVEKGLEHSLPQPDDVGEPAQTDGVEAAPSVDSTQNVASKREEDLVRNDEVEFSLPEEEEVEKKADVLEEAPNDMSSKEVGLEPRELLITENLGPSPSEPENVEEPAQVGIEPPPVDDSTKDVALKPEGDFIEENELEAQLPKAEEVQKHPDVGEEAPAPTHKEVGLEPEEELDEKELEATLPEPEHIEEQAQTVAIETAPAYDSTKEIGSKSQGDLVDKTELEASLPKAERVENQADVVEARKDTSTKETGLEPQEERVEKGFEPSLPQPEDVREPAQTDGVEAAHFDDSTQNVTSKPEEELVRNDEVDDSLPEEKEVGKKADVVEEAPNDISSKEDSLDPQELLITQDLGPSPSEPDNVEEQAQVGVEPTPVDDSTKEVALKPEEGFIEENELGNQLPEADQVQKHPDLVEKAPAPSNKEFGREPEGEFVEKELEPSLPEPENIEEPAQTVGIEAAPVYDSTTEIPSKSQGDLVNRTDLEASLPKAEGIEKQAEVVEEARDDTSTEETGLEPQEEMVEKGLEPSLPQLEDVGEPAQTDGVEAAPFDDSTQNVASKPEEALVRKDELEDSLPEDEQVEKKADVLEEAPTDMSSKEVGLEPQELLITKDLGPSPSEPENVEEQAQVEVEPTPVDDSTKDVASKPEEDFIEENELEAQLPKAEEVQKHPDLVEEAPAPTHKEVGLEPEGEIVEKELEPSLPEPEHIEEQAQTVGIEAATVASEIEGPAVENQARLGEREVEEQEPPQADESTVEAIVEPESGWTQGKELDASPVDLGAPKKGVASDVVGEEPLAKSVEEIALEPGTQAPGEIELDESQTEPEVNHTVFEAPVSGSSREVALEPESDITSKNEVEIPPVEVKLEEAPERQDGLEEVPGAETTREPAFEPEEQVLDKEEVQAPPSEPEVEEREATGPNNMEEDRTGSSTEETIVDPQTGPVGERDEACLPEQEVEEDATHTDVRKEATSDEPIEQLGTDPEPIGEPVLPTPKETSQELVEEFSDKELEASPAGPNKAVEPKEPTSFVVPEDIPVEQTSKDMVLGPEDVSGPTSRETSEERVGAPAEETELEASSTEPEAPATVEVPEKAPIEEAKMNVLSEPERTPKPVLPTFSDEKDLKGSLRQPTEVKPADSTVQEEPIAQTSKEVKEDTVLPHPGPVPQGHEEEAGEPVQELEQEANEQELTPADVLGKTSTGEVNLNPDSQFIKGEKTQAPDAKAEAEEKEAPRSDVVQENPTDDTLKEAALEPESEMAIEENAGKADSQAYEIGDKGETVKENDSFPSTAESKKEDLRQADELQQATFAGYPMDTALRPEGEVVEGKDLTMPAAALEMVKKDVSQDDQVDQAPVHGGEAIAPDVIEEEPMTETTKEAGVEPEGEADEQQEFEVPLAGPEVEEQDDVDDVLHNLNDSTKTVPFEPMQQQVEKKDWVLPLNKREVIEEEPVQTDVAKAPPVNDPANKVPSRDLIGDDKFEASLPQAEGVETHTDVVEEQPTDNSTKEIGVEPKDEVVQKELEPPLPEPEDVAQRADVVDEGPAAESTKEVDSEPEGPAVENQATLGERKVEEKEPPQADDSTEQAIVEPENGWTQGKELDASQVDLEAPKKGVTPDVAGEEPLAKTVKEIALEPSTEALGEVELDASETEPEVSPTVTDAPSESLREVALEPETKVIGIKKDEVPPVEAKLEETPQRQDELEEVPLAETTTEVAFEPEREALDKEEFQAPPSEPEVEEKDATSPDDMEKAPTGSSTEETVVEPQTRPGGERDEACLPEQELEGEGATHTDLLKEATSDEPIKERATDLEPVSELVLPNSQETSKELVKELSHSKELEASPADPKAVESKEPTSVLVPEDIAVEQSAKDMISVSEDVSEPLVANSRETSEERVGAPVEEKELEASSTEHGAIEHTKENLLPGTPKPVLATFSDEKDLVGSVAQPTAAEPAEFIVQGETNEKTSKEVHEETVGTHPGPVPQEGCKEQVIGSMQEMKLKAPRAALEAPNTVEVEQGEDTQIETAPLQEKLPEQEDIVEEAPIESTREIAFVSKTDPLTAVSTEQDEQEPTELRSSTPTEKEKRKGNWDSVAFQAAEPTQVNEGGTIASQAATEDVKEETAGVSGDFEAVSKSEKRKSDEASVDVHSEGAREVDPMKVSNKELLTGHEAAAEEPQEEIAVAPKQLEAARDVPKKKSQEAAVDVVLQEDGPSEKETELGAYSNATFAEVKEETDEVPKECEAEPTFASYPTSVDEDSSWQKAEPLEPESQEEVQPVRVEGLVEATEWEFIAPEAEPIAQRLEEGSKATGGEKDQNAHLDNQPARDAIKGDSSHATDWELVASEMAKSPSRVEEEPKNMLDAPTQEQGGEVAPPVTKIPPSASEAPEWEMVTSERKIAHKDNTQQEPALDVIGNNLTIEMEEPESAGLQQLVPPVEPIPRSEEVTEDLTKEEEKSINTPAVEESTIHAIVELPGEKEEPAEEPVEIETAMSAEIPTEREGFDNDIPLEETTVTPNVQESTSETAVRDGQTKTAPVKSVDAMEEPESEGMEIQDATPAVKPTLQIERVSEHLPVQKEAIPAALHLEEPCAETASRGFPVEIEQAPVEVEGPMKKLDSEEVQIGDEEADSVDTRTVPQELPTKGETMRNINPTSKEPISKVTSRDLSFKSWHPYMDTAETKTKPKNDLAESASPPAETKGVTKIESIQEKSVPTVEEPTAPATSRDIVVEREQAPGEVEEAQFESVKHELKATIQTEEKPKDLSSEEESDANIEPAIEDPEATRDAGIEAAEQVTKTPADYKEAFEDLPTEDATIPVSDIDEPLPEATESNFPIDEKRDQVDGEVRAQASELEGETGKREVGIPTESKEVKKDLQVEETAISASEPKSNRVPLTSVQAAKGHESHIVQDLEEVPNPLQEVPKELDSEVVEKVEARRTEATEIPGLDETAPLQATEGGLGPQLEQVTKEAEKQPATEAVAALEKPEVVAIREKAPEVTLLLPKEPLTSDAPQEPREDTRRKIFVESKTLRGVEEAPKGIAINTPEEETHEAAEEPQTSHAETSEEHLSVWNLKHLQQKYEKLKHKQVLQQEKKNANKVVGLPWPPTRLTHPQDKGETCN